jgi:hypothetical protein
MDAVIPPKTPSIVSAQPMVTELVREFRRRIYGGCLGISGLHPMAGGNRSEL